MSIPAQLPGTQPPKKLTSGEYLEVQNHFLKKSLQESKTVAAAKEREVLMLKQQICDLNKVVFAMKQGQEEMKKDASDKAIIAIDNEYTNGLQKQIKERLGIPLDKGFSFDPNTLKVTVNE